jgi:hypothetical protein
MKSTLSRFFDKLRTTGLLIQTKSVEYIGFDYACAASSCYAQPPLGYQYFFSGNSNRFGYEFFLSNARKSVLAERGFFSVNMARVRKQKIKARVRTKISAFGAVCLPKTSFYGATTLHYETCGYRFVVNCMRNVCINF